MDLRVVLSHEDDQSYFRNAGDPGIANQLRIKRKQADRFLGITAGRGLPVHDASDAVELTDSVNI